MNKKKTIYSIISIISALVFVTALCIFIGQEVNIKKYEKEMEQFVDVDLIDASKFNNEIDILANKGHLKNPIDFPSLLSINKDIYAWISIPELDINYPILQNKEDNYYLYRNIKKYSSKIGCIYTNSNNSKDFSDFNTIVYGHNVIDPSGNMFSPLHGLAKQEKFDNVKKIIVYTPENKYTYDIYAVVRYFDNVYLPLYYDFNSENGKQSFIDMTFSDSKHDGGKIREGIEVTTDDKLITLSTCMLDSTYRLLVIGKLKSIHPLDEGEVKEKVIMLTK